MDGLHANQLMTQPQNVVVVAKSGGDYTSVQAAINDISGEAADNPYLVWVAPGVYEEQVTMKPFVHLQGAGQEATVISSTATSSAWPATQATLVLASNASLRDLTVSNSGAGDYNVALLATAGMTRTLAADVTVRALGSSTSNFGVVLSGSGTGITLKQVTALSENATFYNYGMYNGDVRRQGCAAAPSPLGRGTTAVGISNTDSGTMLDAERVTVLGEAASSNYGLQNKSGAAAKLRGGSFTAHGAAFVYSVYNFGSGTMLEAESITVLGEDGSFTYGLNNGSGATAKIRGGSFTARGGQSSMASTTMATARHWRQKALLHWARMEAVPPTACTTRVIRKQRCMAALLPVAEGQAPMAFTIPAACWRLKISPRWAKTAAAATSACKTNPLRWRCAAALSPHGEGGEPMASTILAAVRRWRPKASLYWARTAALKTSACSTTSVPR